MTEAHAVIARPRIFGTGLIALDLVTGPDPATPVRTWTGGTCGNVLSILACLGWDAFPIARMNEDEASGRIRADMARWNVHLDWTGCAPAAAAPMIVQEIRRGTDGRAEHRFSKACPRCRNPLRPFRPITARAARDVKPALAGASAFFLDRLSRGILDLAAEAAALGAAVVFEPSARSDDRLMAEALSLADVVKYAGDRLDRIDETMTGDSRLLL